MLLDGENEALARALNNALAWAAPDLVSLRTEREVLRAVTDVLCWQGLQVLILSRQEGALVASQVRLDAPRVARLERRFGEPIRLEPPLSHELIDRAGANPQLLECGWDAEEPRPSVLAGIHVHGAVRALLLVDGARFTSSAVRIIGQFARFAGSVLESIGRADQLHARLAELRRAQRSMLAEERLSVLGEAAAVLAHEIRNPLATVTNVLALLRRKPDSPELLDIVGEEIARLDSLTHDLLQLARPLEPRRQSIDLARLIHSTVERVRTCRTDLQIAMEAPPPFEISADPTLLQLALENLLRNAAQVSPPQGEVRIVLSTSHDETSVTVEDQGPGVEPADRARIFEPFFTTRATGTGLGLPIVRRIVQAHGGEVRVGESVFGGARFEMIFSRI